MSASSQAFEQRVAAAPAGEFLRAVGLQFDRIAPDEVLAHIDATPEHHTPWGVVHGGLYATIVESVGTIGAVCAVEASGLIAVGVNNQTDFLRPHRAGRLDVRGTPIQQGKTLQLWLVEIKNAEGKLVAQGQVRLFNQPAPESGP
jgi:uncharacterized protein (TIGR00369 family)